MPRLNGMDYDGGVGIIKYYGTDAKITVPDTVTNIGPFAFTDCTTLISIQRHR